MLLLLYIILHFPPLSFPSISTIPALIQAQSTEVRGEMTAAEGAGEGPHLGFRGAGLLLAVLGRISGKQLLFDH